MCPVTYMGSGCWPHSSNGRLTIPRAIRPPGAHLSKLSCCVESGGVHALRFN
jgi:hypothetical protein